MRGLIILTLLLFSFSLKAQEKCTVLKPGIDSTYRGSCKNGLANGIGEAWGSGYYIGNFKNGLPEKKGEYRYPDGSVYNGSWKKGLRHGMGEYRTTVNGNDTILRGQWEKDLYKGTVDNDPGYKILNQRNVSRVRVYSRAPGNRVHIVAKTGSGITGSGGIIHDCSSGTEFNMGSDIGYADMSLPYRINIRFDTPNKMRTAILKVVVTVEITKPGDWIIEIVTG